MSDDPGPESGPYPPPGSPPPYGYYQPPDHPQAVTAMVLGIVGLVVCQVLAPFAWVMGRRALSEIDRSQGRLGGRSQAQTGYILGIVGTVILGIGVLFVVAYAVIVLVLVTGVATANV